MKITSGNPFGSKIDTDEIEDEAITNDKIADNTITQDKLAFNLSFDFEKITTLNNSSSGFTYDISLSTYKEVLLDIMVRPPNSSPYGISGFFIGSSNWQGNYYKMYKDDMLSDASKDNAVVNSNNLGPFSTNLINYETAFSGYMHIILNGTSSLNNSEPSNLNIASIKGFGRDYGDGTTQKNRLFQRTSYFNVINQSFGSLRIYVERPVSSSGTNYPYIRIYVYGIKI